MSIKKYGFVYIWYDRKHKRYYIGCHWGSKDDGYICSSEWMVRSYGRRPHDFKRRILKDNITHRPDMYLEEHKWLSMIKESEIKPNTQSPRYYNLNNKSAPLWHAYDRNIKTIGEKISARKKGKSTGPCSPEKARKISEAKKASFQRRLEETGSKITEEWREKNRQKSLGIKRTEEWKKAQSERSKNMWIKRKQSININAQKQ